MSKTKILGDFQTPPALAAQVVAALQRDGIQPGRVFEPSCGQGHFIQAVLDANRRSEIIGVELQPDYADAARATFCDCPNVSIVTGSIFALNLSELKWQSSAPLLVIGNPPWVNNSLMGALDGDNLPERSNFKGLRGIDAITGHGNFDIAEAIWLKLITELPGAATIALLCKTSVARNVLKYGYQANLPVSQASIRHIDAKAWFGVAVDACLFTVAVNAGEASYQVQMYNSLDAEIPTTTAGFIDGSFVSNIADYEKYAFLDRAPGDKHFIWRAGVKHDAAPVMELTRAGDGWQNGLGENVDIEDDYLFPLLKSSDIQRFDGKSYQRAMIITQRHVGDDTNRLATDAPRLWDYLQQHQAIFSARKSSIYRNRAQFAIFGIGDYTFAPYKVMVSGFYKTPRFIPVGTIHGRPVICDDTCYLLAFDSAAQASVAVAALNHPITGKFLASITFADAKRPFTKSLLERVSLSALMAHIPRSELEANATHFSTKFFDASIDDFDAVVQGFKSQGRVGDSP